MNNTIIIEYLHYPKMQMSLIKDNEYTVINECYLDDIITKLIKLDKYYDNLILDIGDYQLLIKDIIYKENLRFNIKHCNSEKRTKDRLSLIGFYILEEKLSLNNNLEERWDIN